MSAPIEDWKELRFKTGTSGSGAIVVVTQDWIEPDPGDIVETRRV